MSAPAIFDAAWRRAGRGAARSTRPSPSGPYATLAPCATGAVDALEVAARLESHGVDDELARHHYGAGDVFELARHVYAAQQHR